MVQAVHCNSTVKCQEPISIVELHMVVDDLRDNEDQKDDGDDYASHCGALGVGAVLERLNIVFLVEVFQRHFCKKRSGVKTKCIYLIKYNFF